MIQFYKLQATGNDFVFIVEPNRDFSKQEIEALCRRQTGIGADGFVLLKKSKEKAAQYVWEFYNADGGSAEMCGNAARCAGKLASEIFSEQYIRVKTKAGEFTATTLSSGNIEVDMLIPEEAPQIVCDLFSHEFPKGYLVNTGVPHCVVPVGKLEDVLGRASELKKNIYDPMFGAAGANLTFMSILAENELRAVTLERGVNDFTLSCGTGVAAAAKTYLYLQNKSSGMVQVKTPGGQLAVELLSVGNQIKLSGPAELVYRGELK